MSFDYALETKLATESPELHNIFTSNVMCCQNILLKYKAFFPTYTDHTSLHSLEVISFCNELVAENISRMNCDEIFILLMAAYLHDTGMGITEQEFFDFSKQMPYVQDYMKNNEGVPIDAVIRTFHNEFSGKFIEKHSPLFDFPSEKHLWATIQVSRGHRKTDLFDEEEYPAELMLDNGNVVHLPYLASLIRLSDELDIAADRNISFMYDENSIEASSSFIEFKKHVAIKNVEFNEESLDASVDFSDITIKESLLELFVKLNGTLSECVEVIEQRTPFVIKQKKIVVYDINNSAVVEY